MATLRERRLSTLAFALLLPMGIVGASSRVRRRAKAKLAVLLTVASLALLGLAACGGQPNTQTYQVVLTATSGSVNHSATVNLNLQ